MNDNETKKSGEELADEALDAVAGGLVIDIDLNCVSCGVVSKSSEFKQNDGCCPKCGTPWKGMW